MEARVAALCADLVAVWGDVPTQTLRVHLWATFTGPGARVTCAPDLMPGHAQTWRAFCDAAHACMRSATVPLGDPAGLLMTQAIGEPCTQSMLNTFHTAGTGAGLTGGMARVKELIGAQVNIATPTMTAVCSLAPAAAARAAAARPGAPPPPLPRPVTRAPACCLRDVVHAYAILWDPPAGCPDEASASPDADLLRTAARVAGWEAALADPGRPWSPWVLRLELRRDALLHRRRRPAFVAKALRKLLGPLHHAAMLASPASADTWVVRVRLLRDHRPGVLRHLARSALTTLRLEGLPSITDVRAVEAVRDPAGAGPTAVRMLARGVAMHVWAAVPPVRWLTLQSNHIMDVHATLGVLATERVLMRELVGALSSAAVDPRHLHHLVAIMLHEGAVTAMTRQGLMRAAAAARTTFALASFEMTDTVFATAAVMGYEDAMASHTLCMAMGVPVPVGTGALSAEDATRVPVPPAAPRDSVPPRATDATTRLAAASRATLGAPSHDDSAAAGRDALAAARLLAKTSEDACVTASALPVVTPWGQG